MLERYEVTLRLAFDRQTGNKLIRVGTHRPGGAWVWVADFLCGNHVDNDNMRESVQVAEDLWYSMVGHTVGIQESLIY